MNIRKYRKMIVFLLDFLMLLSLTGILLLSLQEISQFDGRYNNLFLYLLLLVICHITAQISFHTYDSLWRYAQSKEYLMLLLGGISAFLLFVFFDFFLFRCRIPLLFTVASYSVSTLFMLLVRFCYRQYRNRNLSKNKNNKNEISLVIVGVGETGVRFAEALEQRAASNYKIDCFIDDDIEKIGKKIHGIEVLGPVKNLEQILKSRKIYELMIAIPEISAEKRKFIMDICYSVNCRVRDLPDLLEVLEEGENYLWNRIRDIKIEELLDREPVTFATQEIEHFLEGKAIMITGGGGSIGSELCRQIAKIKVRKLIILDNYENSIYDIQQELLSVYGENLNFTVEIASVRNREKINWLFEKHRPDIVFHAAAHKHVPLMEVCPDEAILNNIYGTYNLVEASDRYKVEKFVLISSDKAVNPTNIMGASKRFCEMILQSMKEVSKTEFVAVRFGNVLGSNGSVIPLFLKQIANGGPVTITDKRIVRYFMTISEAVQLVLQAGAMASSSEVYILDMGEPVKILDLAENLIYLSGCIPYTEIPIVETGLRPGEKLYEELLTDSEELIATQNHKIYIEHQEMISQKEMKKKMKLLSKALETRSNLMIKNAMKKAVSTYKDPEEVNGPGK